MQMQSDGSCSITIILDSVDHGKLVFPKTLATHAKEFDSFCKPNLTCTACLIHGYAVVLGIGQPCLQQNSSSTVDLLAYCLDILSQCPQIDLRRSEVIVQGDNATKECKNNTTLRFLSSCVGARKLGRAELRTLQSGHSHEDVDQFFSMLCGHLHSENNLHVPADFLASLRRWLSSPGIRPHDPQKIVVQHDQVRCWTFGAVI